MRGLTVEQILELHEEILALTGGAPGVRDASRIEAAVARPFGTYGQQELFPTLEEKAAALVHSLAKGHPFVDGNKRTAIAAGGQLLILNGYRLMCSQEALEETAVAVAEGRLDVAGLAKWIRNHLEPIHEKPQ